VVAVVVLVVAALLSRFFGGTASEFVADVLAGLEHLPAGFVTFVVALGELLGVGLIVVGGALAVFHRRWRLLAAIAVAVALSVPLFWLVQPDPGDSARAVTRVQEWLGDLTLDGPSSYALAAVVAITAAVTPWTSRRWRRA
jgi:hypothetical protein